MLIARVATPALVRCAASASAAVASCSGRVSVEPTREGVVAGDAARAQRRERAGDVAVDAQLEQLAAEAGEQRRAGVSSATISPAWMIATRSQRRSASSR